MHSLQIFDQSKTMQDISRLLAKEDIEPVGEDKYSTDCSGGQD